MRRRKLNTKRRTGRFEFWQVRQRYHDGSPYEDGSLVLWVRSVGRNSAKGGNGRAIAYATLTGSGQPLVKGLHGGLGVYPDRRDPVTLAKALRRHLLEQMP
jgi:hypothetical protein